MSTEQIKAQRLSREVPRSTGKISQKQNRRPDMSQLKIVGSAGPELIGIPAKPAPTLVKRIVLRAQSFVRAFRQVLGRLRGLLF